MRPAGVVCAVLALSVPLAACGKSAPTAPPRHPAGTSASLAGKGLTSAPDHNDSAAQARARVFAGAVNLRAADVPGFTVSSETRRATSSAEAHLEAELHHCVGTSASSTALAEEGSPEFERNGSVTRASVSSAVSVQQTSAAATRVLAAFRSGRMRACLSRYFTQLLARDRPAGARVGPVSVKHGTPPAPGTSGGFALRFSATITVEHLPVPFYVDVLGFVEHAATVSLLSSGIPEPFPARLEEGLFSLLLERARQHSA